MSQLTDVIVHDIFSPPVASRIYAYASVAAYEVLALHDSTIISLAGQVHGLEPLPKPTEPNVNFEIAAVQAMLLVGKKLIFSEEKMEDYINNWHQELKKQGVSANELSQSLAFAEDATQHILDWADKDNYKQTRTSEKFAVQDDPGRWQPTPPAYIEAIEPHWNEIRTFVLDSADQFSPAPPTKFDMDKKSKFFAETKEVYETGKNLSAEQSEIAAFWDCNPYVMNVHGHVMFATKKITPGGHWIGIVKIACLTENANLVESAEAYALTSITLADAFISCWDEKYRSNLIRPETVINKYMDEEWQPLLQTPPFPEYTSGHSVISSAASLALTELFGDNFHFVDSTEVKYGLPVRKFSSFYEASSEAAISRLYGGIHYRPAIENGLTQGRKVGEWVVANVRTRIKK
ncbi:MAG TPA: vanadium-dependent haloperoxidase [Cyclobacteriaceae bacterium]